MPLSHSPDPDIISDKQGPASLVAYPNHCSMGPTQLSSIVIFFPPEIYVHTYVATFGTLPWIAKLPGAILSWVPSALVPTSLLLI